MSTKQCKAILYNGYNMAIAARYAVIIVTLARIILVIIGFYWWTEFNFYGGIRAPLSRPHPTLLLLLL